MPCLHPHAGADKVWAFDIDPLTASLTYAPVPSWSAPPGAGPRHLAVHPGGRWVYVICEMVSREAVAVF